MSDGEGPVPIQEVHRRQTLRDYFSTFEVSDAGRRVMADMVKSLDRLTYRAGRDALEMAFNEGRRSVLLDLRAAIAQGRILVEGADVHDYPTLVETRSIFDGTGDGYEHLPAAND